MRTLLTTLGIAIGVAAVVALSAFGEGISGGFESISSSSGADLTVAQRDAVMLIISAVDDSIEADLRQISGVQEVVGTIIGIVQMPDSPYFVVMGEEPRGFAIGHYKLIAGEPLASRRQILLGKLAARNFKKDVGDSFGLNEVSYRVVGIYETGVSLEDGGAVISLSDAQRAFDKTHQVSYFSVKVKDPTRINEVRDEIESRWEDLTATRSGEATKQDEALGIYRSFGWFLGIFAVLVGGLGMMNTTLMSVSERTREIGVLRAIGWRPSRIVGMILGESLVLSLLGGLIGIALGVDLTLLAKLSPATETLLAGVLTPEMFVQALVIALLLGAIGGIYPAWRAAQLQPVDAMRREGGASVTLGSGGRLFARLVGSNALRNLWRRPARTAVTMAGIAIGVGFVVALIAITDGFAVMFTQMGSAGQLDLMAEQAKASDASLSVIDERIADRIALRPDVRSVSKLVLGVSSAPGLPYFIVFGLDPHEQYVQHFRIREGRGLERPREVIVGRFAANSLEKGIGDKIALGGSSFAIVGIYESGVSFEDASGVISLREAQELFHKPRQASFLGITLNQPERADEIAREIESDYPEIVVAKVSTFTERMNDMAVTYAIVNALVALTVVVGGVVMMNAMLMSVFERTQEIGVLRALGWRKRSIVQMVLIESLVTSLVAGGVGLAFGVGLSTLFTLIPTYGSFLTPSYTQAIFIIVLALAVVLGMIGGVYPALRAANLQPVEALRYE